MPPASRYASISSPHRSGADSESNRIPAPRRAARRTAVKPIAALIIGIGLARRTRRSRDRPRARPGRGRSTSPSGPRATRRNGAARSSIVRPMISKSAGSAPAATPTPTRAREARREPRDLLGDHRRRPQGEQKRARRRPARRHRLETPARDLERVREVAGEAAVVLGGHHAVESVLGAERGLRRAAPRRSSGAAQVVVRVQPQRDRPRRERCRQAAVTVRSACPRASRGARSSGSAPASRPCRRAACPTPPRRPGTSAGRPS